MNEPARETANCHCGASSVTARCIDAKDELSGQPFSYRCCAVCGSQRLTPRPTPETIGSFYPDSYASHTIRPESRSQQLKRLIYRTFFAARNELGIWRPLLRVLLFPLRGHSVMPFRALSTRRVFELGAATGNDLSVYHAEGWDVTGCEPSERACRIARSRGIEIQHSNAEDASVAAGHYSAILMNNVLEHVHDPAAVLDKCARGLMPGGSLVLIVPNHASWSAKLFGAAWPGYDAPRHLWGFTPTSLRGALDLAGLRTVSVFHRFPGRWAFMAALDGRHQAAPVAAWRQRFGPYLVPLLLPMGWLAAACGFGDFMTVVACKPQSAAECNADTR